jgi:hypothetical protein
VPAPCINEIVREPLGITADTAMRLTVTSAAMHSLG